MPLLVLNNEAKGQLKSEWIYENIDFPNKKQKRCTDFCSESFYPQGGPKSFQEAPMKLQKISGQISLQ